MGDAGRARLVERFDVRVAAATLTDLYRSLA
jgi:hypothetical protein